MAPRLRILGAAMPPVRRALLVAIAASVAACGAGSSKPRAVPPAVAAGHVTPPSSSTSTSPSTTSTTVVPALPVPAPISPLAAPAPPGEGTWQPAAGSAMPGGYAIYTTQLRPAAGSPPAGLAWVDQKVTRLVLYAGTTEPAGLWPHQGYVAAADQSQLLAAFNSGFKVYAYNTGWYDGGRAAVAPKPGYASLVIRTDGTATVGEWGRDVTLGPDVESVRQNLSLLVDHGAPAANIGEVGAWGATLGGVVDTWRSGVGVTAAGDLVYGAGPGLDPAMLARLLVAAGAVRAMELDINPEWVSFALYAHTGSAITNQADLTPGMYFPPTHYLQPDARDFFAVFAKTTSGP